VAVTDQADGCGFRCERSGQSSKHYAFEWTGPQTPWPATPGRRQAWQPGTAPDRGPLAALAGLPILTWLATGGLPMPGLARPRASRSDPGFEIYAGLPMAWRTA